MVPSFLEIFLFYMNMNIGLEICLLRSHANPLLDIYHKSVKNVPVVISTSYTVIQLRLCIVCSLSFVVALIPFLLKCTCL